MNYSDYVVAKEDYKDQEENLKWEFVLRNGLVLTGIVPHGSVEDPQKQARLDAQTLLNGFLGLDVTTLVHEGDPSREQQIVQQEKNLSDQEDRLMMLKQSMQLGEYPDADKMPIEQQVTELEMYQSVQLRKLNELKV